MREDEDPRYVDEEGFEREADLEVAMKLPKLQHPCGNLLQNLRGGKVVEPLNFYACMIVIKENLILVHIPV